MKELFTPPHSDAVQSLTTLYTAMKSVLPLKEKQYKSLPRDIQDLSYILTQNRGEMPFYWSSPAMLSAYFYYFMPWNLVRLAQCIPNLQLPTVEQFRECPYIIDIGSGTLTIPIALWLFRKELRDIPLTIYCCDTTKKPMEYGRALLEKIMESTPWNIVLIDARKTHSSTLKNAVSLITAANIANEMVQKRNGYLEESIHRIYTMLTRNLSNYGQALCIEVGTRLGGSIIAMLHNAVVEADEYTVIAPCTHMELCPYSVPNAKSWCHFSFADFVAPQWLERLSQKAHLSKTTLSTSLLHIGKNVTNPYNTRILSAPIRIPETKEYIRYACNEKGIVVLENAKYIVQGTALNAFVPENPRIDVKTALPYASIETKRKKK